MERENQRIVLTKRLLKEALLRLLKEKELDKVSVTELCKAAEINRATFYRHYDIPRDVLIDIQKDMFYTLKAQIQLPKDLDDLKPVIYQLCTFMDQNAHLLRIIIQNNSDMDFVSFVNDVYTEVWSDLHLSSFLKNLNDEDIHLMTMYSAGGSYFILRSWMMGNIRKSSQEMADYVFELMNKAGLISYGTTLGIPRK